LWAGGTEPRRHGSGDDDEHRVVVDGLRGGYSDVDKHDHGYERACVELGGQRCEHGCDDRR